MIEKWTKMGKRSFKCKAHTKFNSAEKSLFSYLRDSFPVDESSDSGLGSDGSILFADSNSTTVLNSAIKSDFDVSSDSSDSGISPDDSLGSSIEPTYIRGIGRQHIDKNLSISLNDKMHIHGVEHTDRMNIRPRVATVFSLSEPLVKRRKIVAAVQDFNVSDDCDRHSSSRENVLQNFVRTPLSVNRVLTEATVCHNAQSKLIGDSINCPVSSVDDCSDHRLPWSSRENFVHPLRNDGDGGGGGGVDGGDRMVALLAAHTSAMSAGRKKLPKKPSLHVCFPQRSKELKAELSILIQPEEQHRARYMTEGSRGSIKDEKGNGFPTIKLCGYKQPVTLQVFIGSDTGKVQPHLFYQACKVTGKNCTPCSERMIEGTSVIEINMLPENDMTVSCDCIGILKERNVDVEQRLPYFGLARCKKRSTKCRMVFRINIQLPNGNVETLQIASSQILCTQSPGVPEICKKSLTESSVIGGTELFIIGKNFQKDTKILFQEFRDCDDDANVCERKLVWEKMVDPEKEFLHQSHLICSVPSYQNAGIVFPVKVYLSVLSGGKSSEPHTFTYTPCNSAPLEFCKREMNLSPELTSPVSLLPTGGSMLSSPVMGSQISPSICPTSPVDTMQSLTTTMTSPTSPSSSSSASSSQMPMTLMESVGDLHIQRQGSLEDHCTSMLLAIAEASSSSISTSLSSSHSSMTLSPGKQANNDLSGHDVDLMTKIDQLTSEITRANEDRCPRISEMHLPLPSQQASETHTMMGDVRNNGSILSMASTVVSDSLQHCHTSGCSSVVVTDGVVPQVSLCSIVDAMAAAEPSVPTTSSSNVFTMHQASVDAVYPQTTRDLQQVGSTNALDTISNIHQKLEVKQCNFPLKQSLENFQVCQRLPSTSLNTETKSTSVPVHDTSMSYDIQCCSGVGPTSVASTPITSTNHNTPITVIETGALPIAQAVSTVRSDSVKFTTVPATGSSSGQQVALAFSQLSDADLLSMINPSTFDSV